MLNVPIKNINKFIHVSKQVDYNFIIMQYQQANSSLVEYFESIENKKCANGNGHTYYYTYKDRNIEGICLFWENTFFKHEDNVENENTYFYRKIK